MTTPKMEQRLLGGPGELRVDVTKRTIFGLANVFGNADSYGTIFDRGAFKRTIKDEFTKNNKVRLLFNHDPWSIIGRLTVLEETDEGLRYEGRIAQTPLGDEILTHIQDGSITDNSIGFVRRKTRVVEDAKATDDDLAGIHFTDVELWDVSPVTWGANDLAVMEGVRNVHAPQIDPEALAAEISKSFQIAVPDLSLLQAQVQTIGTAVIAVRADLEARAPVPTTPTTSDGTDKTTDNKEEPEGGRNRWRRQQVALRERQDK